MLSPVISVFLSSVVVSVSASIVSVPLTHVVSPGATAKDIVLSDRARTARLTGKRQQENVTAYNTAASYVAYVTWPQNPGSNYRMIIDTASANTWVGANLEFICSSPCVQTDAEYAITYGSGFSFGQQAYGPLSVGPLSIKNQSFGNNIGSANFYPYDGVLGLGPEILTNGTVDGLDLVPTVMQNAIAQGDILEQIIGVYFQPADTIDDTPNGQLDLGGVDFSKTAGPITYTPVLSNPWLVTAEIKIGSISVGVSQAVVDTGTALLFLPTYIYQNYTAAIPGAAIDFTGLLKFPKSSLSDVPTFTYTIEGVDFPLSPAAQIIPDSLYWGFGLDEDYYYSWINDGGSDGENFIIGQKFMERYYTIFDIPNNRVGFAPTVNSDTSSVV